jgi:probable biosynthetic protein (TIGR04098 family)
MNVSDNGGIRAERSYTLNMPQMAAGGLSEQWLFKEMGDLHWRLIAEGLRTPSHAILDEQGNRLYATFIRIRWEGTACLREYTENDPLTFQTELNRYGRSTFYSRTLMSSNNGSIVANLATTFAVRQKDNTTLVKRPPCLPPNCEISLLKAHPLFMEEYRAFRRSNKVEVRLLDYIWSSKEENRKPIFKCTYELNPYADLNGVNLLYCAAYPMIHDICERKAVMHSSLWQGSNDWSICSSTKARDVFYFANCDIDDQILFCLDHFLVAPDHTVKISSSLYRLSDNQLLARVYTIKVLSTF